MGIEALKQQLTEGKVTKEQYAAELKKLLDAGTITQEEHDEAVKFEGKAEDKPLTATEIQAMIKAESQKEADRVRT
ncbi:MAG: SHOCT domain-containing protein, partial [Bacillus sp. (in: firmicutes)]